MSKAQSSYELVYPIQISQHNIDKTTICCLEHLMLSFILFFIYRTSQGLAVIDWEKWRTLWDRHWGTKIIYQTLAVAHVMHTNLSLTVQQATDKAISD